MKIIKSKIVPLNLTDIDTDQIIPAEYLKRTVRVGFGEFLFKGLREQEEDFPLNLGKYKGAEILVAGDNFGCGSSREHAAWALKDYGFKVIISPRFADIFKSNAFKNGLLLVELDQKIVDEIFEAERKEESDKVLDDGYLIDGYCLQVDLVNQKVLLPDGRAENFEIDPFRKECLLKSMDEMDYLLSRYEKIQEFDKKHREQLFFDVS